MDRHYYIVEADKELTHTVLNTGVALSEEIRPAIAIAALAAERAAALHDEDRGDSWMTMDLQELVEIIPRYYGMLVDALDAGDSTLAMKKATDLVNTAAFTRSRISGEGLRR